MSIVSKFTSYLIHPTIWFINEIDKQFNEVRGYQYLSGERPKTLRVTSVHPFVEILNSLVTNGSENEWPSLFPAFGVTEGRAEEEDEVLGGGDRRPILFGPKHTNDVMGLDKIMSYKTQRDRLADMIISDNNIDKLKNLINSNPGKLFLCNRNVSRKAETLHFSVWATNYEEYKLLYTLMKSVIPDIRKILKGTEYNVRSSDPDYDGDLSNADFGTILYGAEASLKIVNQYTSIEVTDQPLSDMSALKWVVNYDFKTTEGT